VLSPPGSKAAAQSVGGGANAIAKVIGGKLVIDGKLVIGGNQ
jgi:hypothetical protein